eukprot:6532647-Prorocentrum_lima.AAC.1
MLFDASRMNERLMKLCQPIATELKVVLPKQSIVDCFTLTAFPNLSRSVISYMAEAFFPERRLT